MTYKELVSIAKNGDVITYKGEGLLAWAVRWWTGEPLSHIGFIMWLRFGRETSDRLCLLHSHPFGGINISPLSEELGGEIFHQKIKEKGEEAVGYALEQWGKRYASPWQFILMMSPWLRSKWEKLGFTLKDKSRYHCSQLVSEALSFATKIPLPKAAAEMTPTDASNLSCLERPENVS